MDALAEELRQMGIETEQNCLLAPHSSFRIGGVADLCLFPKTREELSGALQLLRTRRVLTRVIGNASNVVFPDEGCRGAVIFTGRFRDMDCSGTQITVSAGTALSAVAVAARNAALSGAEFLYGIPGTIGGAVFMNAGAFGGCMEQICVRSEYFDRSRGTFGSFCGAEHQFGVRTSVYEQNEDLIVLSVELALTAGTEEAIGARMEEFAERRRTTQPLNLPSAGSVFKRPAGHFAGKLIEDCGLKGLCVGGAQVSQKHAGFIVNRGGATASDVKRLVAQIQETVYRETGVLLEPEIRFLK